MASDIGRRMGNLGLQTDTSSSIGPAGGGTAPIGHGQVSPTYGYGSRQLGSNPMYITDYQQMDEEHRQPHSRDDWYSSLLDKNPWDNPEDNNQLEHPTSTGTRYPHTGQNITNLFGGGGERRQVSLPVELLVGSAHFESGG